MKSPAETTAAAAAAPAAMADAAVATGRRDAEPAVVVRDLERRFGHVRAVDGVSFTVARGSLVALLGPNGAGKSTTLDVLEGFARADAGHVRVLGLDPWTASDRLRPRLGVMLQSGGLAAGARAGEMLTALARCSAHPLDPAELLRRLGLEHVVRTPVRRLSGGEVQRLSLAMALVGRPELLILDEPTGGLDPQARRLVWDLIAAARADGVTILLTTHLLPEVEQLADRVVIIAGGRVVANGTPAELTAGGTDRLTFTSTPGLDLVLLRTALPGGMSAVESRPGRYQLAGPIDPATVVTVTSFCARVGALPTDLQVGARSLDEVFLELTAPAR